MCTKAAFEKHGCVQEHRNTNPREEATGSLTGSGVAFKVCASFLDGDPAAASGDTMNEATCTVISVKGGVPWFAMCKIACMQAIASIFFTEISLRCQQHDMLNTQCQNGALLRNVQLAVKLVLGTPGGQSLRPDTAGPTIQ